MDLEAGQVVRGYCAECEGEYFAFVKEYGKIDKESRCMLCGEDAVTHTVVPAPRGEETDVFTLERPDASFREVLALSAAERAKERGDDPDEVAAAIRASFEDGYLLFHPSF